MCLDKVIRVNTTKSAHNWLVVLTSLSQIPITPFIDHVTRTVWPAPGNSAGSKLKIWFVVNGRTFSMKCHVFYCK